ncbi:hypothetical protein ACWGIB_11950 [Streptomyces xiamenensis]
MRGRITAGVAAAITAGVMLLALPGPALAAEGVLTVSGATYENPAKGCYTGGFSPLVVENRTNVTVFVHGGEDCKGVAQGWVSPGEKRVFEFGGSVQVPS